MDGLETGRRALLTALCQIENAETLDEARKIAADQLRLAGVANIKMPDEMTLLKARELKAATMHYAGSDSAPPSVLSSIALLERED